MIILDDKAIVARARLSFKNLVIINIIILVLTIVGGYLGTMEVSLYFAIFYAIETLMFVVFLFLYSLITYVMANQLNVLHPK